MSSGALQRWCDPNVILVATNLHDQPALMRHAAVEAKRCSARLLLVHVIPPPVAQLENLAGTAPSVLLLPSAQSAADALDHMALRLQWQGIFCEPVVLRGRPDEQIHALVHSRKVDRVIVAAGSRQSVGGATRWSFAERLVATLPVPVCVVGSQVYPEGPRDVTTGRVLLALSLHAVRRDYVDFACGVAETRRARLTLLHVLDPSAVSDRQRAHDAARLHLAALAAVHDDLRWRPDIVVREGDPADQIVEQAACPFQDIIVLGSSSLTLSRQEKDSGVVRRVIAKSRCPVITLKPLAAEVLSAHDTGWPMLRTGSLD